MASGADPVWTERPTSVSRENPLGVTTTRNRRLFNDLLYPLLSDAITYRLRYASFWAWVLANTDSPDKKTRARYEKIFFLSNIAHDCPDDGHSSNGIVGAERKTNGEYLSEKYTADADKFDLTAEDFELTSSAGSGFDVYYQSLMHRLWLVHGKMSLTPIGQELAGAFGEAVAPTFGDLRHAVQSGWASQELVQHFAQSGCCCQLQSAAPELRILLNALIANFEETDDPTTLQLHDHIGPDSLGLDAWYPVELRQPGITRDESSVDTAGLTPFVDDEEQTTLADYFQQRLGGRARATVLLFLASTERVQTPPAASGWDIDPITDIRIAWQFFVHTHYFVIGTETLLKAWLHGIRHCEPISTSNLLAEIFNSEVYRATIESLISEDVSVSVNESECDQLWRCFDAIYYGKWFDGAISVTHEIPTSEGGGHHEMTWNALVEELPSEAVHKEFGLSPGSARILHDLIHAGQSEPSDLIRAQYLAGLATILLAQLYRRGQEYKMRDEYEPYSRWFNHIAAEPNPQSLWRLSHDETTTVESLMRSFTRDQIVARHQAVTRRKIRDRPSQTPRHMQRRPDGSWEFKSMYKTSHLSQSWNRIKRLLDALYELNLITDTSMDEFRPTDRGCQLLNHYGIDL